MKKVGIKQFQRNIYKYLNDLPFEITRFGRVAARVVSPKGGTSEIAIGVPTEAFCMEDFYELNKDHWYATDEKGEKIPHSPWWEFWCPKHKKVHGKP